MPFLQIARKTGGARLPVALTDQKFWGKPAVLARRVQPVKFAHRLDILAELMPVFWFLPVHCAAVASADRVDKNEIRFIQE